MPVKFKAHKVQEAAFLFAGLFVDVLKPENLPVAFDLQVKFFLQVGFYFIFDFMQLFFVFAQDHHVVHVAHVMFGFEFLFNQVVQLF